MKKLSFLALAAVGLLLGACSSDKDVANEAPAFDANGEAYVGFTIQIPTSGAATRANDDLNNGEEDEFLVNKARLLLFKGTYNPNSQEADVVTAAKNAEFFKAYDFEGLYENDNVGANEIPTTKITSTAVAVAKIDKFTLGTNEKLFAYVVINPNGSDVTSTSDDFGTFTAQKLAASTIGGDVNGNITGSDGLLMTSSPISDKIGGGSDPSGAKVTTGVILDEQNIKETKAEAKAAPAGCIFVERAAAKVTLKDGISNSNHNISMGSENVAFVIDGWQIINMEPKYYNTRQCEDAWLPYYSDKVSSTSQTRYRFVTKDVFAPTIPTNATHTEAYRTYFAKDPQYSDDYTLVNPVAAINGTWNSLDGRAFVPENTFDVKHQTWRNTTQVTVRVKFNGGTGFYTLSDDAAKYDKTNAQNAIQKNVVLINKVKTWLTNACEDISANKASGKKVTATLSIAIEDNVTDAGAKTYTASVSFKDTDNTEYAVSDITDATVKGDWDKSDGIKETAEDFHTVNFYKDGYSYYNVRIQHFGEYETPWSGTDNDYISPLATGETKYTVKHIYAWDDTDTDKQLLANRRFLGRYGVVRDNWYQLSIDGISKLGSATPIDVSGNDTPDDMIEDEYYISAHVHILPWVIRKQSVSF